jgi:beta-galactosidase
MTTKMATNLIVPKPIWENPEIQEINRLPMRSPLIPFTSPESALADAVSGPEFRRCEDNPLFFSLDGTWSFKLVNNPQDDGDSGATRQQGEYPPEWTDTHFKTGDWDAIQVPGTWTLQGGSSAEQNCSDKPHYTNVQMPFDAIPPHAPEHNPTGLYRRSFTLLPSWKDRRTVLHVGSAESCLLVYVNGIFAGAGKDTRLPQEFDLSPYLNAEEENVICLKVVRYSDASYIEDQDQWWFGGIHRSVYLYSTESCYIEDIRAVPGSIIESFDKKEGILDLSVTLGGDLPQGRSSGNAVLSDAGNGSPFSISYALYPFTLPQSLEDVKIAAHRLIQNKPIHSGEINFHCNYRLNSNTAEVTLTIPNPAVWSHEAPNLYILTVSLSRDGKLLESAAFCTGFRTVRLAKRELLINEKAVLIKGVNRHEHDEKTGKTLSIEGMLRDIKLLKRHNFNAVRTRHYPNDERWYELCDRYGIYLTDEADIEHHCFYDQLCRDTAWSYAYISRVQRMAQRDKNHPSVIIWSLGNESGDGGNNALCSTWIRRYDSSRPVHYEGAIRPERGQGAFTLDSLGRGKGVTDIIGPMYPEISLITDFVKYRDDDRPLIMCEFSHGMGNSNGSLADYWKAVETYHGLQGGYIWDWIDQGIEAFAPGGQKYWKYGGDFGDDPTDYDFCLNGILFPNQSPKPVMAECKQLFSPVRLIPVPGKPATFTVENRFDFSTLDGVYVEWRLCDENGILAQGRDSFPNLIPGASSEITLLIPAGVNKVGQQGFRYIHADICLSHATPWAASGFVIGSAERVLREQIPVPVHGAAPAQSDPAIAEFAALFKPSLFRVPTENDGLKTYIHLRGDPAAEFYYKDKAMYPWLDLDLLHFRCVEEKTETVPWEGSGAESFAGSAALRYTAVLIAGENAAEGFKDTRLGVYTRTIVAPGKNNPLIMDITFDLEPGLPELPKVGITAKIPAAYGTIKWFGRGPQESYPDRCAGAFLGSYTDTPESLEVPYIVPQENGNRMGVRSISLEAEHVPAGKPKSITIIPVDPVHMSVSRYTRENQWKSLHTYELVDVSAGGKGYYFLNIDIAQRGVGSATCGPDTLEQYRVRPGIFKMRLYIY